VWVAVGVSLFLYLRPRDVNLPERLASAARMLAPLAVATAWLLPAAFVYAAALVTRDRSDVYDYTGPEFQRGMPIALHADEMTATQLAERLRPVFLISDDERWPIASVRGYLRKSKVRALPNGAPAKHPVHPTSAQLPVSCQPEARNPSADRRVCYALTGGCEDVTPDCDHGRDTRWPHGTLHSGRVYARVIVRGVPQRDRSPAVFQASDPFPSLYALVQYWLFYRNDLWRADSGLGRIEQRHEADWELVMVGVSKTSPLFVAYSAHCGGEVRQWADTATASDDGNRTRPAVWVARGSHANYPDPNPREPDFTSCARADPRQKKLLGFLAFAANLRETLPDSFVRQEPAVRAPIDARTPPFGFPGRWAETDAMAFGSTWQGASIPPDRGHVPRNKPAGPQTPTCKRIWRDPLAVLACDRYWGEDGLCTHALDVRYARTKDDVCVSA
jgi:hypothetical protein